MVYIVENNGVYGLTKGQFSATADEGQKLKYAGLNELPPIDVCWEALIADCGFVARSFAGDPRQVETLLKAAFSHRGTAVLDIISPCVSFNDHPDSTKSYAWGKEHEEAISDLSLDPSARGDHRRLRRGRVSRGRDARRLASSASRSSTATTIHATARRRCGCSTRRVRSRSSSPG